ncbi:MAG: asparagine synthetase A [Candidatus Aenigmatarchaeota archaeon]
MVGIEKIKQSLFSLEKRHLTIRDKKMICVLRVQDRILRASSEFLSKEGFVQILAPILSTATDPGIRGAKQGVIEFYGRKMKLMSSMLLHKQMAMSAMSKIFAFSPCIRFEDEDTIYTGRHLVEFYQLDLEAKGYDLDKIMDLGERLITYVIKEVKKHCKKELAFLGRELKIPKRPFKRLAYEEAISLAKEMGFEIKYGEEIPWEAEKALSEKLGEFFWIIEYPKGSRGFYDKIDPKDPRKLRDFDLFYPEGYGEAISGSERETELGIVKRKMEEAGIDMQGYEWYFEMLAYGIPQSAGFGIGIERLTRFICGLEFVWEAAPFPKVAGVVSP